MATVGSVYQRRTDGRWVACISVNGKRISRYAVSEQEVSSSNRCQSDPSVDRQSPAQERRNRP